MQIVIAHSVHTFCVLRICRKRPDRFFPGCKLFCSELLDKILVLLITIAEKRNTVLFPAHEEVFYNIRNLIFHECLLCFSWAKFSLERLNSFFCFLDTFVHGQNIAIFRFDRVVIPERLVISSKWFLAAKLRLQLVVFLKFAFFFLQGGSMPVKGGYKALTLAFGVCKPLRDCFYA